MAVLVSIQQKILSTAKLSVNYSYIMYSGLKTVLLVFALLILCIPVSQGDEPARSESFMSIYSDGKKVGYSHISIDYSDGITQVDEKSELNITLLDKEQTVKTEASYTLSGFILQSFSFRMISQSGELSAAGIVDGDELKVKIKSVSGETNRTLRTKEGLTVFALLPKWLAKRPMSVGGEYKVPLFEPSAVIMGVDADDLISTHKVEELEEVENEHSGLVETFRVTTEFLGSNYTTWITRDGEVIKQTIPPGLTAVKDSGADNQDESFSTFDITTKTSIPTDVRITNPRGLGYLRAEVTGLEDIEDMNFNDGYRQQYKNNVIEIRSQDLSQLADYALPYNAQTERDFLLPTYLIQSDDELMKAKARAIVKDESDPVKAASQISRWVYKTLKKEGTVSLPNALDVLKTKKGDCNEHAVLFAALARASGIPTKVVMGTIYIDGRFYYHAWNEVFLGKWVAVDSTYGQLPADATHIKLIEGDLKKSGEIMKVVGKIKIKVLDAS
jgi:transglutaminase-like putative cysteine protease